MNDPIKMDIDVSKIQAPNDITALGEFVRRVSSKLRKQNHANELNISGVDGNVLTMLRETRLTALLNTVKDTTGTEIKLPGSFGLGIAG